MESRRSSVRKTRIRVRRRGWLVLAMVFGLLIYCGRLAWSLALSENEVQPPPVPLLVEGEPGAVERLFRYLGRPWCGSRALGLDGRSGRLVLAPAPQSDFAERRRELVTLVDELESSFALEGTYPKTLEEPGWNYATDGEDFELSRRTDGYELTYSSRTGLGTRAPEPAVPQAALLTREGSSWVPWGGETFRLVGLTATAETLDKLAPLMERPALESPLRVTVRGDALPVALGQELSAYSHFELEVDPFTRACEVKAFHDLGGSWIEPRELPPVRAQSTFWLVGNSDFLGRLGLEQSGASPVLTLYGDEEVESETVSRVLRSASSGRLRGTGAGQPVPVAEAVADLGRLPGEPAAAGSFVWQDADGQRWRWLWAAGSGAQKDWMVSRARPVSGSAIAEATPTCGPDTEALHTLDSTVPAASSEGDKRRLSFTE